MEVSIWEGNKAQALIDAITNTQKIDKQQGTANAGKALVVGSDGLVVPGDGIPTPVKTALLKCFRHVAWIDGHGEDCYDELEYALFNGNPPEPDPEWGTDYTWLYRADQDGLLSANSNISVVTTIGSGLATETIVNNVLKLYAENTGSENGSLFKIIPDTISDGILKAKVKFNALPTASVAYGLRMQVGNGTNCAQLVAYKNSGSNEYSFSTYENDIYRQLETLELNKWYIISCELQGSKQILTIDDSEYTINTLSSYSSKFSRFIIQEPSGTNIGSTDVDVAWITFKNTSV